MYLYEDRIRAVKLHIKLGKRTGLTIRQLGYPTKNVDLTSFHRHISASSTKLLERKRAQQVYLNYQRKEVYNFWNRYKATMLVA